MSTNLDPAWDATNIHLVDPQYVRRTMKDYEIQNDTELHELIITTHICRVIYRHRTRMTHIHLYPRHGHKMIVPAQLFHSINWYLAAHTNIQPFLTSENGMMQRQSGNRVRNIGKVFLMAKGQEDPDFQRMKGHCHDFIQRKKLEENFFNVFYPNQHSGNWAIRGFGKFCLDKASFVMEPVYPLGYDVHHKQYNMGRS